jgi:LysR family transcriptional regulator for metE and metH
MRLEVRDLRLVVAVAELGTLTRAGQQLHLTQSALSHQLADLERRIGQPLFQRAGRTMVPTRVGEQLATRARETLRQLRDVEKDIVAMATGRAAVLRVATQCYTCYHWLPPLLRRFGAVHPEVDVRIVPEATARPIRALVNGKLDLCVVSNAVRDRRVTTTPLFEDELLLVVPEDDPMAGREYVEPSELRDRRILSYSRAEESSVYRNVLGPAGVHPRQIVPMQLTEAILELVKAQMGVAILARWAVQPYLERSGLAIVQVGRHGVRRQWQAATRVARSTPGYIGEFITFLGEAIARPPRRDPEFAVLRSVAAFQCECQVGGERSLNGGRH